MMTLEYVKKYQDDLLTISKGTLKYHHEKLRAVLMKLQLAGLKINATKSTFCSFETEYLGYTLNREGIAPQTQKVELILQSLPPTKVKELCTFLEMVQYYRDM